MRTGFILLLAVTMIALSGGALADGGIEVNEVGENTYEFSVPSVTDGPTPPTYEFRWDFGDGGTSMAECPVHQFEPEAVYNVRVEITIDGTNAVLYNTTLDLRSELIDESEGTLNVGDVSVPGLFLLISCTAMFIIVRSGLHPLGGIIGADVMQFFYALGILAGAYLTFMSIYPGGI